jgi:hypothetical protein
MRTGVLCQRVGAQNPLDMICVPSWNRWSNQEDANAKFTRAKASEILTDLLHREAAAASGFESLFLSQVFLAQRLTFKIANLNPYMPTHPV